MKGSNLGELEELVLLVVGVLYNDAYTVTVMDEILEQTDRNLNISAVHAVLRRLENKGLVSSTMGGATNSRGGRRKRIFVLTMSGKKALDTARELRNQLYEQIPSIAYNFS